MNEVDKFLGWLNGNIAFNTDVAVSHGHSCTERRKATVRMEILKEAREKYLESKDES